MNNKVKLINIVSIACRAGKVMSGEFVIEKALSSKNNIKLILLANDVADATKAKYEKMAKNSKVLLRYTELTKDEMANSIGKTDRAAIAALSVFPIEFAISSFVSSVYLNKTLLFFAIFSYLAFVASATSFANNINLILFLLLKAFSMTNSPDITLPARHAMLTIFINLTLLFIKFGKFLF